MKKDKTTLVAVFALLFAVTASAGTVSAQFEHRAHFEMSAQASQCTNNPGPFVTLNGELSLSGIDARIILTNNARFTHVTSADITADLVLIPTGESIRIAKQPPLGGVGGNPYIFVEFHDCNGNLLSESPAFLGRCVQGLSTTSLGFTLPSNLDLDVSSGSCSNSPGPFVTLNGALRLGGLCGTIIFTNNRKFTHVTAEDVTVEVELLPEGSALTFAKQPPLGGVGGNPFIWAQFLDEIGNGNGDLIFVGRCNQLE